MNHTLHPKSSTILSTGYDAATQALEVKFAYRKMPAPGKTAEPPAHWKYDGVPADVYEAMKAAPSIGAFFAAEIKPNYTATRLA